jgi:signal transduction histidine kinase
MILATLPIQAVDFIGSVIMIVLSLLCLRLVRSLNTKDPNNLIWTYLLWVCYGLAVFSVSRSIGHILKQILLISGHKDLWNNVMPLSGAINTFMLTIVAAVTLFFERIWKIYRQILEDKQTLQKTHNELLYLNQNLERLVSERTEALARSEKKMAQADKLASIGHLSAGIAHEINNPLGIILGYTQLLLRCETPDTQKHEDLKTIEKHVKNCKSIVEDLLNFARSSKTKKEIVNIHDLLDKVLNFICHNSKFDKVRLEKTTKIIFRSCFLMKKRSSR